MGNCIDYFYNPKKYRLPEDEIRNLKIGQVVWFIHSLGQKAKIHWGIIDSIFMDGVVVELYSFNSKAMVRIDGELIDYKLAPERTKDKPLPKNWSYKTDLRIYKKYPDGIPELYNTLYGLYGKKSNVFKTKESIRKLIEDKVVLPNIEIDFSNYDVVIDDRTKTYINVKRICDEGENYKLLQNLTRKLEWSNVFTTYETAEEEYNQREQECNRKRSLTDDEWAKEEVARQITLYFNMYVGIKDIETCQEYHRYIMEEIEAFLKYRKKTWYDIYVKLYSGELVYRFKGNIKWKNLVDDIYEIRYIRDTRSQRLDE